MEYRVEKRADGSIWLVKFPGDGTKIEELLYSPNIVYNSVEGSKI